MLGNLTQLRYLDVSHIRLTALPEALGNLTQLQHLDVSHNRLTALPVALGNLIQLQHLNVSGNRLSEVSEMFARFSQLQWLDASHIQLTALPEALGNLIQLQHLNVSGNQLTSLPIELCNLSRLEAIYLHGNLGLSLPEELLGPTFEYVSGNNKKPTDPKGILDYYFRTRASRRPLNEAKLVLVGFGGVGKTSLVSRLIQNRFNPREFMTDGISIADWSMKLKDADVQVHVWDFGGQEIMHSTHQFFLTYRSLYIVVLNGRQGREDADAEYWLNLIASFGGESPVIVVLNKIKEHPSR